MTHAIHCRRRHVTINYHLIGWARLLPPSLARLKPRGYFPFPRGFFPVISFRQVWRAQWPEPALMLAVRVLPWRFLRSASGFVPHYPSVSYDTIIQLIRKMERGHCGVG